MPNYLNVILILALAGSKYIIALALIFSGSYNFGSSVAMLVGGGMMGVVVFSYCGDWLKTVWRRFFPKKKQEKIKINAYLRRVVRIRQRYGLAGIAFLTPILLTVPVGAMMASHLYKSKLQIFTYMLLAFAFWSFLFCGLYYGMGFNLGSLIHG